MHERNRTTGALRAALALIGVFSLLTVPAGAKNAAPNPEVRVTTSMGSFVIELRPHRAPLTVKDFLHYVRSGFYTNTLIHRVVANFIIQGGGYEATPPYALKPTGPPVVNESGNGLENRAGTVGLARGANPDSGTAQFYINLVDNPELDPLPTRWGYAVFGKVIRGMSVVERIGLVPTGSFGPFKSNAPLKPIVIKSIQLITPNSSNAAAAAAKPATPHPAVKSPSSERKVAVSPKSTAATAASASASGTKPSTAPSKPSTAPSKPSAAPSKPSAAPSKPSAAPSTTETSVALDTPPPKS